MLAALIALAISLAIALSWRSLWAPAVGAATGVAFALTFGVVARGDIADAAHDLWRPLVVIGSLMVTTACAAELGVFAWLASRIEPRTRGPVRAAFRFVFALSAVTAALLSNDAAILLLTPVVIALLRAVYPRRHPQLVLPFAFAVFAAAGVAPLPTGNPMNLVVSERAGIDLNTYAIHMIPVAFIGWLVTYAVLSWRFRAVLDDEDPALGEAPSFPPLIPHARLVMATALASIATYPILAGLDLPLWPVATIAAVICVAVSIHGGVALYAVGRGVSWELFPFLFGVLVLATGLARVGLTTHLADLYAQSPAPLLTIGSVAAAGSAVANNHPIALLHSIALANAPDKYVFAALIGGDLGPRLLPMGSLAGLLWLHALRRQAVAIDLRTFASIGVLLTIPSLLVSLAALWLTG